MDPLLKSQPSWPTDKYHLTYGISCPLNMSTNQERFSDLTEAIGRGNHKSAKTSREKLADFVSKDVKCLYKMPLEIEAAKKIKYG